MKEKRLNIKGSRIMLVGCLTPIVVIALILIIAALSDASTKNKKKEAAKMVADTSLSVEKRVESAAISAVGKKDSNDDSRNIKVKRDGNTAKITLLVGKHFSSQTAILKMQKDSVNILKSAQKIKDFEAIAIIWQDKFVDKYGNNSVDDAMRIFISKQELAKINFKNFNPENLPKVSYNYYIHPAYLK